MTHNSQTESQPTVETTARAVGLTKAIKYEGQKGRIYANPCIDDFQLDSMTDRFQRNLYASAFRRKFYRIGKQVPDYLLQTIRIAGDWLGLLKALFELDLLRFCGQSHSLQSSFDQLTKLDRLNI